MYKIINKSYIVLLLCVSGLFNQACNSNAQVAAPKVANPAAQKCVQDGYTRKVILSPTKVPTRGICINKSAGKKCEEWAYFRGECQLASPKETIESNPPLKKR